MDQVCAIKIPPGTLAPQSRPPTKMARTYRLSLGYNQCLGAKEDPFSFSSLYLEDLRNGDLEHLVTIQQLVDALPKTEDPASRFALRAHTTLPGHKRPCHPMRAALWWLLPSDGELRLASHALHFYLARQGRRVVFRGGNVTRPFYESRVNWVPGPAPPIPRCPDDLTSSVAVSPSSIPASAVNTPPSEAHPKLIRSFLDALGDGEGVRRSPRQQPMKIQLLAPLTSRPRLRGQPIEIQLTGERPSPGPQPMTAWR